MLIIAHMSEGFSPLHRTAHTLTHVHVIVRDEISSEMPAAQQEERISTFYTREN